MAKYEALANLSVPREDKTANIVQPGEIVELEAEVAEGFLKRHRVPMIRPASERTESRPRVTARDAFGARPGPPAGAEPDPAGATQVVSSTEAAPEASDPQPEDAPSGRKRA